MKKDILLAGEIIFVEEGSSSYITTTLAGIGEVIEDYCGEDVLTSISSKNDIHTLRFDFSRNRFIEFETIRRHFYISSEDKYYCVLRLKELSNFDRRSLVMKVMLDVFDWS